MNQARRLAFIDLMETAASLGANAVIGVNYEVITRRGSMLLVSSTGTAVTVRPGTGTDALLHAWRAVNPTTGNPHVENPPVQRLTG